MSGTISRRLGKSLSSQLKSSTRCTSYTGRQPLPLPLKSFTTTRLRISDSIRSFTSKNGNGNDDNNNDDDSDPFGMNFEDSTDEASGNIGPRDSLPPNYIRDSATGKFTGDIQAEVSPEDKQMLNMGPIGKERLLTERFEENLEKESVLDKGGVGADGNYSMGNVARRIREEEIAFNTLGRKVTDLSAALEGQDEDGMYTSSASSDSAPVSAPLTEDELESLHRFMEKTTSEDDETTTRLIEESENLIPTTARRSTTQQADQFHRPETSSDKLDNPDLEWLTARAQRSMDLNSDEFNLDEPFSNLLPSDFDPAKKVNRRRAKPIPKQLLSHNNLSLLRRYVTPGGQIMNRVQSRLGAKDQRKIAKLVKRARHLGLIPVLGQWKIEDHGNVRDPDLFEDKEWEKKLIERGLVERKSEMWEKMRKTASEKSDGEGARRNTW